MFLGVVVEGPTCGARASLHWHMATMPNSGSEGIDHYN